MGTIRQPAGPRRCIRTSRAIRVGAESAEVTPLQTLPPMVPTARSWGPPAKSVASPSTETLS